MILLEISLYEFYKKASLLWNDLLRDILLWDIFLL